MPRGAIDMPAFVRALRKVKYGGVCSLEYEKDMDNPLLGIAESVGYFRGRDGCDPSARLIRSYSTVSGFLSGAGAAPKSPAPTVISFLGSMWRSSPR